MITVILSLQAKKSFFKSKFLTFTQPLYFRCKNFYKFIFRDTAQSIVFPVHTDVVQLVQIAEHADLSKLGDTRQEYETKIAVSTFQNTIESFQDTAIFIQKQLVQNSLKKRFVVFVNQDHNLLTGLFAGTANDTGETGGK